MAVEAAWLLIYDSSTGIIRFGMDFDTIGSALTFAIVIEPIGGISTKYITLA